MPSVDEPNDDPTADDPTAGDPTAALLRRTFDTVAAQTEPGGDVESERAPARTIASDDRYGHRAAAGLLTAAALVVIAAVAAWLVTRSPSEQVMTSDAPGSTARPAATDPPTATDPPIAGVRHLVAEPPPGELIDVVDFNGPLGGAANADWQLRVAEPSGLTPVQLTYAVGQTAATDGTGVQILQWPGATFDASMIEWRPSDRPLPPERVTARGLHAIELGADCPRASVPRVSGAAPTSTHVTCTDAIVVWTGGVVALVSVTDPTLSPEALADSLRVVGAEDWDAVTARSRHRSTMHVPPPNSTAPPSTLPADGPFCSAWRDAYTRAQQSADLTDPVEHAALLRMADAAPSPEIAADIRRLELQWRTSPPDPDSANVMGRVMTAGSTRCGIGTSGPGG